jgi:hypothetical protein
MQEVAVEVDIHPLVQQQEQGVQEVEVTEQLLVLVRLVVLILVEAQEAVLEEAVSVVSVVLELSSSLT